MRSATAILLIGFLAATLLPGAEQERDGVFVRVVRFKDGSVTETIRIPEARTIETITKSPDGVLTSRQKAQLNASGEPAVSMVYDAQGSLLSRTDYVYDQMGRKVGERTFNRKGRKIRDVIYTYDKNGKANPPVTRNYTDAETPKEPTAPMAPELTPHGRVPQPPPKR